MCGVHINGPPQLAVRGSDRELLGVTCRPHAGARQMVLPSRGDQGRQTSAEPQGMESFGVWSWLVL